MGRRTVTLTTNVNQNDFYNTEPGQVKLKKHKTLTKPKIQVSLNEHQEKTDAQ